MRIALLCLVVPAFAPIHASTFTLHAERAHYLVGQPVYLRIGSGDAAPPSLEEGAMVLSILGPDGREREYRPPLRFRVGPAPTGAMPAPRVRFARVIASEGALVFDKPGRYRLRLYPPRPPRPPVAIQPPATPALATPPRVSGADTLRPAVSDSLVLTFALPVRAQDKRAFAILSRDPGEYALAVYLEGGQQLRTGMAIMRELAGFPNAYRRSAAFVLSSDWAQDYRDGAGGASRPLDLSKALETAQWDTAQGTYIPLRNAYRLGNAAAIMADRDSTDPGLKGTRDSLAAFHSRLSPLHRAWFRSF